MGKLKQYGNGLLDQSGGQVCLGIDQSYTGFGLTALTHQGCYQTWVYSSAGIGVARLASVRGFLRNVTLMLAERDYEVHDTAMEGYAFGSQMANMLGELGAVTKLWLYDTYRQCPVLVPPTSLKKFASGNGRNVTKAQMLLAVYKEWDVEFKDDNAADSYTLARMATGYSRLAHHRDTAGKLWGDEVKYRQRSSEPQFDRTSEIRSPYRHG